MKITYITIEPSDFELIIPLINKIESIRVHDNLKIKEAICDTPTLIDKIILKYCIRLKNDIQLFAESLNQQRIRKRRKPNLFKIFKRISVFCYNCSLINESIKQSLPSWEIIECKCYLPEDLEIITNPMIYQNGAQSFKFFISNEKDKIYLSDKFISNIWEIKPKSVYLKSNDFEYKSKSNFKYVLSQLPNQMKITFSKFYWFKPISLRFSNVVLKFVQDDRDDFLLIEWKSFIYEISQYDLEGIKVMRFDSEQNSEWLKLNLAQYGVIVFEDFNQIIDLKQAIDVNNFILKSTSKSKNERTVFVLAKDISEIQIQSSIVSLEDPDGTVEWLISKWSEIKSFSKKLTFPDDYKYLSNFIKLFSSTTKYTIKFSFIDLQL